MAFCCGREHFAFAFPLRTYAEFSEFAVLRRLERCQRCLNGRGAEADRDRLHREPDLHVCMLVERVLLEEKLEQLGVCTIRAALQHQTRLGRVRLVVSQ